MATHSSILAWEITWTEEPGKLQSMGLQRVGHNLVTKQQQQQMYQKQHCAGSQSQVALYTSVLYLPREQTMLS